MEIVANLNAKFSQREIIGIEDELGSSREERSFAKFVLTFAIILLLLLRQNSSDSELQRLSSSLSLCLCFYRIKTELKIKFLSLEIQGLFHNTSKSYFRSANVQLFFRLKSTLICHWFDI